MAPPKAPTSPRQKPARSRYGYDHRWWGEPARAEGEGPSYWSSTRRPIPCLVFIAPMLVAYELGVAWLGGSSADSLRAGADAWLRQGLGGLGLTDRWLLPLGLVTALLAWQAIDGRDWRFPPIFPAAMLVESLALASVLIGLSRVVDAGFSRLDGPGLLATARPPTGHPIAPLIGFLGAGLYEEALFRLALVPAFFRGLRLVAIPPLAACTLAMTASSVLFSLAHHAGTPGEAFTWFAFIFRWSAGVFFAWVFVVRGFGVAVGTHTAYDILVGWFGWHL
ncbi:CPBP family intramembrane glutamic endopeptidase [Tundrisphaera sp. TA3]|uniref:CPBP family intramembrane glutamic endopeptidase n=1 Tax=Tundrisphaera sp. TA3 TaxID=3435775 RepID=UPI003EBA52EC